MDDASTAGRRAGRARPAAPREVVVVAARHGWEQYRRSGGFVCRAGRPLGGADRMAFYLDKAVQPPVARVLHVEPAVPATAEEVERRRTSADPVQVRVGDVLATALEAGTAPEPSCQVVVLSRVDDAETVDTGGVRHDGPLGWCRSQRYTTVAALAAATTTAELDAAAGEPAGEPTGQPAAAAPSERQGAAALGQ